MAPAPTSHAVANEKWVARKPNPTGPAKAPPYTPTCTIDVAAAGADGLSRTTANCSSPGHAQPRPNPSTVPSTSAGVPGTASSARPPAPSRRLAATTGKWPPARRSASQPCASRSVSPTTLPRVRVSPADPASMPRSTAEATRNTPSADDEPAARPEATPITDSAPVARSPGTAGVRSRPAVSRGVMSSADSASAAPAP